jgi:hypothetical protein
MHHPLTLRTLSIALAFLSVVAITHASAEPVPSPHPAPNPAPDVPVAKPAETNDPAFHAVLQAAARDYAGWSRADDSLHFAPTLCRAPMPVEYPPAPVRMSASEHADSHGRKLYFLYANNSFYYPQQLSKGPAPVGLSIVKQSWEAVEATPPALPVPGSLDSLAKQDPRGRRYLDFINKDGTFYHTGEQKELFVMHHLDPATPNTDDGWIYGTLSPDGQTVTSSGRVASCMGCHTSAPHGRLFGLPKPSL